MDKIFLSFPTVYPSNHLDSLCVCILFSYLYYTIFFLWEQVLNSTIFSSIGVQKNLHEIFSHEGLFLSDLLLYIISHLFMYFKWNACKSMQAYLSNQIWFKICISVISDEFSKSLTYINQSKFCPQIHQSITCRNDVCCTLITKNSKFLGGWFYDLIQL
jgi:hypothetical protein